MIQRSTELLMSLINDILFFTRSNSEGVSLHPETFSVQEAMEVRQSFRSVFV